MLARESTEELNDFRSCARLLTLEFGIRNREAERSAGISSAETDSHLSRFLFNNIVAFKKSLFIFNNIVALMCSLLFLNGLANHGIRLGPCRLEKGEFGLRF